LSKSGETSLWGLLRKAGAGVGDGKQAGGWMAFRGLFVRVC